MAKAARSQSCELSALLEVVRLVGEEQCSLEDVPSRLQHSVLEDCWTQDHAKLGPRLSNNSKGAGRAHSRSLSHTGAVREASREREPSSGDLPLAMPCGSRLIQGGPCMSCGVTEAPQWRRPDPGNLLLCNRCGIHFMRYRKLPGPKKGEQIIKVTPPDSPMHAGKRKAADSLPDDQDTSTGPGGSSTTSLRHPALLQPSSASGPASEPVILHKAHVRRHPSTSNSILDGPKHSAHSVAQPGGGPTSSSDTPGRDQGEMTQAPSTSSQWYGDATGGVASQELPRSHVHERRRSSGPVLQGAYHHNSAQQPHAQVLDPHQLQLFLQLTQSVQQQQQQQQQQRPPPSAPTNIPLGRSTSVPHPYPDQPAAAPGGGAVAGWAAGGGVPPLAAVPRSLLSTSAPQQQNRFNAVQHATVSSHLMHAQQNVQHLMNPFGQQHLQPTILSGAVSKVAAAAAAASAAGGGGGNLGQQARPGPMALDSSAPARERPSGPMGLVRHSAPIPMAAGPGSGGSLRPQAPAGGEGADPSHMLTLPKGPPRGVPVELVPRRVSKGPGLRVSSSPVAGSPPSLGYMAGQLPDAMLT